MIHLAFKRMINQKIRVIITILAMVCIFTLIPMGIHFAQESKLAVTETIEEHGRGSYDILVRPANSRSPIEKELGVVEENYIGDSAGGISVEEWNGIKDINDIEIAAPVASLGYFSGNQTNIKLPLLEYPARFIWHFHTSDGVSKYPIEEPVTFTYFEHHLTKEVQFPDFIYPGETAVGYMGFRMPKNYYLLTGIDQESESSLTGIDFSSLNKDPMDPKDNNQFHMVDHMAENRDNPELFPVLQRSDLKIPLYLSLTVEELDIQASDYKRKYEVPKEEPIYYVDPEREEELLEELDAEPALSSNDHEMDLSTFQNPFDGISLEITDNFEVSHTTGGSLMNDTGVYYVAEKINYDFSDEGISVQKVDDETPPSYKRIKQKGESFLEVYDPPFMLWQMDTFSVPDDKETLAASPLGIYGAEDVTTEDGTILTPTITPGSFIAAPAAGVTTLEAAELIKGDKPIDAIRIRVAGIDTYNEAAQEKIDQVALYLLEQGYEVDIVAGSSFKEIDMDVEGIGTVTAPWTTLGIAQSLKSGFNLLALITIICFSLFGVAWFSARLLYERNSRAEEDEVLSLLGWRNSTIKQQNMYEQFILLTISVGTSIGLLQFTSIKASWYFSIFIVYLIIIGFIFVVFSKSSKEQTYKNTHQKKISFFYYRQLIIPIMVVIVFSVALLVIQLALLIQALIGAQQTTLGAFVIDETFYLQLFVLMTTIILVTISISEAINAIIRERKVEFQMYHTIGWSRRMIRYHFGKEVFLWAGLSLLIGGFISSIILHQMEIALGWIGISFISVFVIFLIGIMAIIWTRKYGEVREGSYASSN